jgi:hypothetical protein
MLPLALRRLAPLAAAVAALLAAPTGASAAGAAVYSTVSTTSGACLHGQGLNCNHYAEQADVFLSGGPANGPGLDDGAYTWAIIAPGSQSSDGWADGQEGNLSDDVDADGDGPDAAVGHPIAERTFTVVGGQLVYTGDVYATGTGVSTGTAAVGAAPFAGSRTGVYTLAICAVGARNERDCKFDNFKVDDADAPPCEVDCEPVVIATALTLTNEAEASASRTFPWSVEKSTTTAARVKQLGGGTATFGYDVAVTKGAGVDGDWVVAGTLEVFNPNAEAVSDVAVGSDVLDEAADTCEVDDAEVDVPGNNSVQVGFSCTYAQGPALPQQTSRGSASWPAQALGDGSDLFGGSTTADFRIDWAEVVPDPIDDCAEVTDAFTGDAAATVLGTPCASTTYATTKTVPVPAKDCATLTNTARTAPADGGPTDSAEASVRVCGPLGSLGMTQGFWQNNNGQGIVKSGPATAGVCNVATWLRQLAPFADLSATASCAATATYVNNVVKAAQCTTTSKTCGSMLKSQMLATALDVFFSDPALGGAKIAAHLGVPNVVLGAQAVDLQKVCKNPGTCSAFEDASAAFGGAASLTVAELLAHAAGRSNAGGSVWYGQVKATQVLAKDVFDAINNRVVFPA